jgi:hypothetical protein
MKTFALFVYCRTIQNLNSSKKQFVIFKDVPFKEVNSDIEEPVMSLFRCVTCK